MNHTFLVKETLMLASSKLQIGSSSFASASSLLLLLVVFITTFDPLFRDSLSPLNLVILRRFVIFHRLQGVTLHCWVSLNKLHGWCERDNPGNKYCSRTKTKHRDFLKLAEWLILTEKDKRHIDMRHWSCDFSTTEGSPPSRVTEGFCVTKRWLRYLRTARSQGKTS